MTTKNTSSIARSQTRRVVAFAVLAGAARLAVALTVLFGIALLLMNAIVESLVYTIAAALMLFWASYSTPHHAATRVAQPHRATRHGHMLAPRAAPACRPLARTRGYFVDHGSVESRTRPD